MNSTDKDSQKIMLLTTYCNYVFSKISLLHCLVQAGNIFPIAVPSTF